MTQLVQRAFRDSAIFEPQLDRYLKEAPKLEYDPTSYRDGGEGFIWWANENICVPIYPEGSAIAQWIPLGELPKERNPQTGKSYATMWWSQQRTIREALRMRNSRFIYRLIVLCWQRGEGKSLLACIIQLWKFFNWPRQQIMLGANSKDQIKFVHYDIMRDIVRNSPDLMGAVGNPRNIQEKEIRLKDDSGGVRSIVRSISSFSGIVSNITGYTFSEIFDMKKPKFFVQLDGSIRNMPNAFGIIDSTVSDKTHVLYQLYQNALMKKTTTVYFDYRYSRAGDPDDYINPYMTEAQLNDYKAKFPFGEYERYFLNLWEAGRTQIFTPIMVDSMQIIAADEQFMNAAHITKLLKRRHDLLNAVDDNIEKGFDIDFIEQKITAIDSRFKLIDDYAYMFNGECVTYDMLAELSKLFDTDWAVLAGLDIGDPLAVRGQARTILTVVAKGLIGSKSNPLHAQLSEASPKYLYILLYVNNIENHTVEVIKEQLDYVDNEYDGIDTLCSERYGAWDIGSWCEERSISFEPIYPNYDRQKVAFKELYNSVREGRFKSPAIPIYGTKKEDLFREEMSVFDHDLEKKRFGSPEKFERGGIQDDSMYSGAWCLYGGRELGFDSFRVRKSAVVFGFHAPGSGLLGKY